MRKKKPVPIEQREEITSQEIEQFKVQSSKWDNTEQGRLVVAFRLGMLASSMKKKLNLPKGEWVEFMEGTFDDFDPRSVQRFMRVFSKYDSIVKAADAHDHTPPSVEDMEDLDKDVSPTFGLDKALTWIRKPRESSGDITPKQQELLSEAASAYRSDLKSVFLLKNVAHLTAGDDFIPKMYDEYRIQVFGKEIIVMDERGMANWVDKTYHTEVNYLSQEILAEEKRLNWKRRILMDWNVSIGAPYTILELDALLAQSTEVEPEDVQLSWVRILDGKVDDRRTDLDKKAAQMKVLERDAQILSIPRTKLVELMKKKSA